MENLKAKYEIEYLNNKVATLQKEVEFWKKVAENYASYFEKDQSVGFDDNKKIFENKRDQEC